MCEEIRALLAGMGEKFGGFRILQITNEQKRREKSREQHAQKEGEANPDGRSRWDERGELGR